MSDPGPWRLKNHPLSAAGSTSSTPFPWEPVADDVSTRPSPGPPGPSHAAEATPDPSAQGRRREVGNRVQMKLGRRHTGRSGCFQWRLESSLILFFGFLVGTCLTVTVPVLTPPSIQCRILIHKVA